jgi:uncharacterized damage-inducible protein DinB
MNELEAAAEQLRQVHEGPAWHGPSMREALEGVNADIASRRPPGGAHSIWELVLHVAQWEQLMLQSLQGGKIPNVTPEQDFPASGQGEQAWRDLLRRFDEGNRRLRDAMRSFPEGRLRDTVPGREYDFAFLVRGAAQHTIYHAGQISILKKMLSDRTR